MRLRKIQLSGFKSFVDPTTIGLPGSIVAVVGPNGCGKSNVIDAVRWVMGESSAKHLRGDLMADVIFNGSSSRKPVGQAAVELVFDNAEGRLGERYAAYAEISVRRQVTRDGHSVYMLNGTRCRRRDITDVFLGTGLGPRSYAIIEQGTISRVVEARPEELREFLEEAAGISRYKERRRETETRIRHTEENLERLRDLRDELENQIERLRRQAAQAERFKALELEQGQLKAELLALRWQVLQARAEANDAEIAAQTNLVEASVSEQRRVEAELERHRVAQGESTERFNDTYRQVLQAGADVGRVEESIAHLRSQRETLGRNLDRERDALERARQTATSDAQRLDALEQRLQSSQPELERHESATAEAREGLDRAERAMAVFAGDWEEFNQRLAEPTQVVHVEQGRIEHLEAQAASLAERIERLETERNALRAGDLEAQVAELGRSLEALGAARQQAEQTLSGAQASIVAARERGSRLADGLHAAREQLQELRGRRASLEALQAGVLGAQSEEVAQWLAARALQERPRLAETIRVRRGWETAVETVLGRHLESYLVESLAPLLESFDGLEAGSLGLVEPSPPAAPSAPEAGATPLSERIESGAEAVRAQLSGVFAVADLPAALALRGRLAAHQSVVTRDGIWLGPHWARVSKAEDASGGVLAREQEIRETVAAIDAAERSALSIEGELQASREALTRHEAEREQAQASLAELQERHSAARSELAAAQAEIAQRARRARDVEEALIELNVERERSAEQLVQSRGRLEVARAQAASVEREREVLLRRREELEAGLAKARELWQALRQDAYETGLRVESTRSQIAALQEGRERLARQVAALEERCEQMAGELDGLDAPIAEAEQDREHKLRRHGELDGELTRSRAAVEAGDLRLRELEQERQAREESAQQAREELGRLRIAAQETAVRRDTLAEQLSEAGHAVEEILTGLDEAANESAWSERLEQVERRISRLGPINLAAIDEYEQQSERKQYLDAQHDDLSGALETLQEAIRKIDRDTRARFKETYERVNSGLSEKFPRLFGGGSAYLELTSDDLLEAGISVMARPPGKRNSSIHLLSGGEKALTAVALVFAIFDLNPAPFCLLDEVDAPLDDANVARFGELVREMAEQVQMVLVTHNKVTMEAAQQLIGVTMNEPGVSRLVAVDLDAAVEMAAD